MKIVYGLTILMIVIFAIKGCTQGPIHITEHMLSNGNKFACIYESKEDFEQAQLDHIFNNVEGIFYTDKDGNRSKP